MDKSDKKERIILCTGLALVLVGGFASRLIKVPMKIENVTFDRVPAITTSVTADGMDQYTVSVPSGYTLKLSENGEFYGYKETIEEETIEVTLEDYVSYQLSKGFNKK